VLRTAIPRRDLSGRRQDEYGVIGDLVNQKADDLIVSKWRRLNGPRHQST